MADENLVLSGSAPGWDRLAVDMRYKRFGVRWFFGFLESVPLSLNSNSYVQRYIVGRALQYSNSSDLVVGLGEVSVLAGVDRPIDWSFFNPLAFHLEIEQNDRSNNPKNTENALWFLSLDKRLGEHFRFTSSFIVDEIKFERSEAKKEPDMLGWQERITWSKLNSIGWTTLYASYVRVDTYTYQHTFGYANWVARNQFLGYPLGNDADELKIGGRLVAASIPAALELNYAQQRQGVNSLAIDNRYYHAYHTLQSGRFPSGEVRWQHSISFALHYEPKPWLKLDMTHRNTVQESKDFEQQNHWTFQALLQFPIVFTNI
jgi:hypothetical protein